MSSTKQTSTPEMFSTQAEESLIGAVLINPGCFSEMKVQPGDFFIRRLGWVWSAFEHLYNLEKAIDYLTVSEELERAGKLKELGGPAYLTSLINNTPSSLHAAEYADTVKDFARRRQWLEIASQTAKLAYNLEANLDLEASLVIDKLLKAIRAEGAAVHISEYIDQVLTEAYERQANPIEIWGIPTGFIDFDRITGGLQPSEILYISGEPGVGKSMLADQMGAQMAEGGHPGAIYSLEMLGKSVARRMISAASKVPTREIKTGKFSGENFNAFLDAAAKKVDLPLFISDSVKWTTASLRADLARLKAQEGIQWFVLDYAYLLQDGQGMSENDRTGLISANMKAICRSLDLAGIVIHSMNKRGMDAGTPEGGNLRGNNQQFYDTDLLMFLVKSEQPNTVTCIFGKGRELEQPKQAFDLHKAAGYPLFANAETRIVDLNGNGYKWQGRKDL